MNFEVRDGCFAYQKNTAEGDFLLKHISFEVHEGDSIAILGANGVGKTTLLRCMMGFLQWKIGENKLNGRNIREIPYRTLWQQIAYVPQARNAVIGYSVEEMVLLGRNSHFGMFAKPSKNDVQKSREAMEKLNILPLAKKKCSHISGGELQMVLIARALAAEPALLILDEPESNLDFKNQLIILDTMSELTSQGISCIFNTHYPVHALQRANKALLLENNGNYIFGKTSEVITENNIASAFGVKAVIGVIETQNKILRDILPLEVMPIELGKEKPNIKLRAKKTVTDSSLAIIGIIAEKIQYAERINTILHEYSRYIIGRMGMPYGQREVFVISIVIDAPCDVVEELSNKLGMLNGVSIKTTYSKE